MIPQKVHESNAQRQRARKRKTMISYLQVPEWGIRDGPTTTTVTGAAKDKPTIFVDGHESVLAPVCRPPQGDAGRR